MLELVLVLNTIMSIKQQVINMNGKYQRNKHQKSNIFFGSNLLKIDKTLYKNIGIYNIGYITIKKSMIIMIFTV